MTVSKEPTMAELIARIKELETEKQAPRTLSCKIAQKGGLSVYGLGRFPVTLYASQWDTLLAKTGEIKAFLDANRDKLATKGEQGDDAEVPAAKA